VIEAFKHKNYKKSFEMFSKINLQKHKLPVMREKETGIIYEKYYKNCKNTVKYYNLTKDLNNSGGCFNVSRM